MIVLKNINRQFKIGNGRYNKVLKDVSLDFPENGLIAIYGRSGSGKTTLLNIIGGLDKPDSGKICIDGNEYSFIDDNLRNKKIGFIFQNYYLERNISILQVLENQMKIAGFTDKNEINRRCKKVLSLVGLERFKNKTTDALSGGQKQRVAIARGLVKGSDIILADEPTGNLDSENTKSIMEILKQISKKKLVILVTHEHNLIEKYSDAHIELVDGKVTFSNIETKEFETNNKDLDLNFEESNSKRTGNLYNFKNVYKDIHSNRENAIYSTANVFKQIFLIAFALVICFLSMSIFELTTLKIQRKSITDEQTLLRLTDYSELRKLDSDMYDDIDYFTTQEKNGSFVFNNYSRVGSAETLYTASSLKNVKEDEILFGKNNLVLKDNEVMISESIAKDIKKQIRVKSFRDYKFITALMFDSKYKVVGIIRGSKNKIYFNQERYINNLGIYTNIEIDDPKVLFFPETFKFSNTIAQIKIWNNDSALEDDKVILEIDKDFQNTVDSKSNLATVNSKLLGAPLAMQIKNSKVFVKEVKVFKGKLKTDFNIYVNKKVADNIFQNISPNLDVLRDDIDIENSFFIITNKSKDKQIKLKKHIDELHLLGANLEEYYDQYNEDMQSKKMPTIIWTILGVLLLFLVYYFIEKAESINNRKEYGILRAVGVSRSNLLFKEFIICLINSLTIFTVFFILGFIFLMSRYLIMNITIGYFIGISFGIYLGVLAMLSLVSLIPYLFVIRNMPATILAKYDI